MLRKIEAGRRPAAANALLPALKTFSVVVNPSIVSTTFYFLLQEFCSMNILTLTIQNVLVIFRMITHLLSPCTSFRGQTLNTDLIKLSMDPGPWLQCRQNDQKANSETFILMYPALSAWQISRSRPWLLMFNTRLFVGESCALATINNCE